MDALAESASVGQTAVTVEPKKQLPFEQIKRELLDPHAISKRHDIEGRSNTARSALGAKASVRNLDRGISKIEDDLGQFSQEVDSLHQLKAQKTAEQRQRLDRNLVRLKTLVGFKDAKAMALQTEIDAIGSGVEAIITPFIKSQNELGVLKQLAAEAPDPKKLIEAYDEKMKTLPLANEEKRRFLQPEVLANLTTEEYIALWRRLNPYFLSHVTRQGFRDHNAMEYHSGGLEEFHEGFTSIMEDSRSLRPPIALQGLRARDEVSVREFLDRWVLQAENEEQARKRLHDFLNATMASAPKYPDKTAVHFATQIVADDYYGGERGNEIFFLFPSDVIASQYQFAFNGGEKDFTKPQNERKWNDTFVWPQTLDNPGIPVDSGFVFLPETTPVDPNTGSKYASELKVVNGQETRAMIEDTNLVNSFIGWGKELGSQSQINIAIKAYKDEARDDSLPRLRATCMELIGQELEKQGFSTDAAATLTPGLMSELYWQKSPSEEVLLRILRGAGANWKSAENTIPAKEYWEAFFAKNPQLKPKHAVYYNGHPTTAVYEFQRRNSIGVADTSGADGKLLGFDDHHIANMWEDPRANVGYSELVDTANKLISDRYQNNKSVAQTQNAQIDSS